MKFVQNKSKIIYSAVALISTKKNKGIRWSRLPRKRLKYLTVSFRQLIQH